MENDDFSESMLISKHLINRLKDMLQNALKEDEKSLEIALVILETYVRDGSTGVKNLINKLIEEEISDKD